MKVSRRIHSIDIVRGVVMVLMAIDHVRVYSGLPAGGPTPGIFFTRWVTHFCAPAFVFLAGTSAFLHGEKLGDRWALSRFLATRGIWLVLLEMTVIRLAWTFNVDFGSYLLAGVIWVLGWSMIVLAALVHLPIGWIASFSLIVISGHNLFDGAGQGGEGSAAGWAWQLLYLDGGIRIGANGPVLVVLYVLIPWVAVMAAGYAFGTVLRWEADRRRRACLAIGLGASALFVVLRGFNLYGDPRPWSADRMPAPLSFLNTTKYPASLLFLLMTLGPVIALLPRLEEVRGRVAGWLEVFGRVPLFYYLLHIPLIHLLAVLLTLVREPAALSWLFVNHPVMVPPAPDGYVWSLGLLYVVTILAVVLLYWPCRWFADLKRRSKAPWLSYL
jgi:uncharacterized membrane protein